MSTSNKIKETQRLVTREEKRHYLSCLMSYSNCLGLCYMGNFCFMDIVVQLYNFQKNKFYTKLQTNRALMRVQKQALQRNDLISFYRRGNFKDEDPDIDASDWFEI